MRLLIILSFFIQITFNQITFAQAKFVIRGNIDSTIAADIAYLYYPSIQGYNTDSVNISDNKYEFGGSVDYPVLATIELKDKENRSTGITNFYLENTDIEINNHLDHQEIKNSRTEDLKNEFLESLAPVQETFESIQRSYQIKSQQGLITKQYQDSIDLEMKKVDQMNAEAILKFVQNHSSDFFSLYLLESLIDNVQNYQQGASLYDGLSQDLKKSVLGKEIEQKLQRLKMTEIGSNAPDFELTDLNASKFKLSDFKGKYVLLLFWSSDCSHCLAELPYIQNLYQEFQGDRFEIIAIAQNNLEYKNEWEDFVRNHNLKWVNAFDDRVNGKKKVARLYNVNKIPTNFLLNPQGQIILRDTFGDELINKLKLILNLNK